MARSFLGFNISLLPLFLLSPQPSPGGVQVLPLPSPGRVIAAAAASEPFHLLPLQPPEGLRLDVHLPGRTTQPSAGIVWQLGHEGAAAYGESSCLGEDMGCGGAAGLYPVPASFLWHSPVVLWCSWALCAMLCVI